MNISDRKNLPPGIGIQDTEIFQQALEMGRYPFHHIRLMFIGHYGVGKSTLAAGLLGMTTTGIESTDGIDVHIGRCYINNATNEWHATSDTAGQYYGEKRKRSDSAL